MNKVKMLKLSVEDVYTEDMRNIESYRYSHEACAPVEQDCRIVVQPLVRSRVVPIGRYFKQTANSRSETLVSIDMNNFEDWLPIIKDQINVAVDVLINEHQSALQENQRLYNQIIDKDHIINQKQELINDFLNMNLYQKFIMLMAHKLFK